MALLAADGGGGSRSPGVAVVPLANAGVLLVAGERRVLVDALFGDGLPGYATVPPARRADLEAARGEFAGVDLVLATHAHRDHFDAAAVARHLAANPAARFVSTPQAVAAIRALPAGAALADRLHAVLPDEGERATLRFDDVTVTAFQLHHGRGLARPVANLGFLVELGGRRVVHLGDTAATAEELAATGLAARGIDLALVPFWRLLDEADRAAIRRALRPARLTAMHVPLPAAPVEMFGADGGRAGLDAALGLPVSGVELLELDAPTLHLDAAADATRIGGRPAQHPARAVIVRGNPSE